MAGVTPPAAALDLQRVASAGVSWPELAVVDSAYAAPGRPGGYACDVEVIRGDRRTGERLAAVGISPLWAGSHGQGLYAPPARGTIVVVSFVFGSRSLPFVSSIAPFRSAAAADANAGEMVLTSGRGALLAMDADATRIADSQGAEIDVSQGRVRIAGDASLLAVLDAIVDAVTPIAAAAGSPWPAAALKARARQALR